MIEGSGTDYQFSTSRLPTPDSRQYFCNVCSHEWSVVATLRRFRSIDELVRVVALRRDDAQDVHAWRELPGRDVPGQLTRGRHAAH